jgi:NADPH-dependent 2,4-dienoyl-CoA reductase/sulfur reductase-like enzyme
MSEMRHFSFPYFVYFRVVSNKHVVIIGNGVAGITAARHLRKNDASVRITVISAESEYFFSRTALMYVYMGHMKFEQIKPYEDWFWKKNRIDLIFDFVEEVKPEEKTLRLRSGEVLPYGKLVIASGSRPRFFDWPGRDLEGVQGLVSLQDLENLERRTPPPMEGNSGGMRAAIVGGGLIGVELAEMLLTRSVPVTMLVREKVFWGSVLTEKEGQRIGEHIRSHGVDLRLKTVMDRINGDGGRVSSVTTASGETVPCDLLGITTGVTPNIEFLDGSGIEADRGILVDNSLQTNLPDIYAAGDCAQMRTPREGRRALEPVWYVGRMMGEVLGDILAGKNVQYLPGPWFNSAKFFDIEYQVYGNISTEPGQRETHFFREWSKEKFITLSFDPVSERFKGINSFGIRLRHEYFDRALREGKKVGEVVSSLHRANFDPEFTKKWTEKFKVDFQRETGIKIKRKKWLTV